MAEDNCFCRFIFPFLTFASYIICVIFNILSLIYTPYNDSYNFYINNLKKSPISSISIDNTFLTNINRRVNQEDNDNLSKMFNLKRLDEKYNYKYLLKEDIGDKNFHPCGIDSENNYLFLPNEIECPINEIEITTNQIPSKNIYQYKTISIFSNIYLHYSNNNIYGKIINDISLNISNNVYSSVNYTNFYFQSPITENNLFLNFIAYFYLGYKTEYDTGLEKRKLTLFNYAFNAKSIKFKNNMFSLILLFIILFFFILTLIKKENLIGLHFINTILILIVIYIQFIIFFYLDFNDYLKRIIEISNIKTKYNIIIFFSSIVFFIFYMILFSCNNPDINYYYLIIYVFRYGFNCDIFEKCKNKNNKNKIKKINELDKRIEELNKDLREYINEKDNLLKENKILPKKIDAAKVLYNEKCKKNNRQQIDINFILEEEIRIETNLNNLLEKKKREIEEYNNIKKEIEKINKKINFYRMKKLNKQFSESPIIY